MVISILLPSFVLQYGTFFFKWIIFPECFATPIKRTMHLKIGVIYLQNSVASMFTFGKHFGYSNTSTTVFLDYRLSNDPCPKSRARAKNYDSSWYQIILKTNMKRCYRLNKSGWFFNKINIFKAMFYFFFLSRLFYLIYKVFFFGSTIDSTINSLNIDKFLQKKFNLLVFYSGIYNFS